ncbi:MAG: hypothetical protein R6U96_14700 [Promethearchaeia archaeon]
MEMGTIRKRLKERFHGENKRRKYRAVFERFGSRSGYKGPVRTILLKNLVDGKTHKPIADHLWIDCGKRFDKIHLTSGDLVEFYARVDAYEKGYKFKRIDYRLVYPSKVRKLNVDYNLKKYFKNKEEK